MGDLSTAISTINNAVVKGTSEKQLCAWRRFQAYLQSIGIVGNPFKKKKRLFIVRLSNQGTSN